MADAVREALGSSSAVRADAHASCSNPLAGRKAGAANRGALKPIIDTAAGIHRTDLVCGFTSRVREPRSGFDALVCRSLRAAGRRAAGASR
ncbi:MAG: hypothetical protein R3F11_29855 [Verrucomicrobiales bacterium]